MSPSRRPWRVWVHDIGPNYSFTRREAALERAAQLVAGDYAKVTVIDLDHTRWPLERNLFRHDAPPMAQIMDEATFIWRDVAQLANSENQAQKETAQ